MGFREFARKHAGRGARELVRKLRVAAMGPSVFQTELGPYQFVPDPSPVMRLTLLLPSVSEKAAFGGITTAINIFQRIGAELSRGYPVDLRIITTSPEDLSNDNLLRENKAIDILPKCVKNSKIPTRKNELFFTYNWYTTANIIPLLISQKNYFLTSPRPLFYIIQDYEPGFYSFSSDHIIARWTLESSWPTHAIVNSSLLAEFIAMQRHQFAKTYVFEPCLNSAMRPFLAKSSVSERRKQIVMYGRPLEGRNCFPIIKRGLELWAKHYPEQSSWRVCSVGASHRDFKLDAQRKVTSIGKLSLQEYARLLCQSAIGISMMASPHPSYPPLEMAHFGMLVITNKYAAKDLSHYHENIFSLPDPLPETLAEAIAQVCQRFEVNPTAGVQGRSRVPGYTEGDTFAHSPTIAADIATFIWPR